MQVSDIEKKPENASNAPSVDHSQISAISSVIVRQIASLAN
jgi:hypothetical protein